MHIPVVETGGVRTCVFARDGFVLGCYVSVVVDERSFIAVPERVDDQSSRLCNAAAHAVWLPMQDTHSRNMALAPIA